jgi:hypothetical protein
LSLNMSRTVNQAGNPSTLVAAHPGNQNRFAHGAYSPRRELEPRAAEIAEALLEAPHTVALDRLAAEEIGALVLLLDRVDAALSDGRVENRRGQVRSLIDLRNRLSGRLERWLREFGLTPASRADFAATLAQGGLAAEIARRRRADSDAV